MAGIDHILTQTQHIHSNMACVVDRIHSTQFITSDHAIIFADIQIITEAETNHNLQTRKFLYKHIDQIPLIEAPTNQAQTKDNKPPWFTIDKQQLTTPEWAAATDKLKQINNTHKHSTTKNYLKTTAEDINQLTTLT